MDKTFTSYKIEERSFIAYIKREIHISVARGKFSETQVGEIDIIVSELTSNIIKHAGSGELLYRTCDIDEENSVFEIVCIDKGPGIADTSRVMKDGVSTTKTPGNGLGAIERLSSFFQIYSIPRWGTLIYARVSTHKDLFKRKPIIDLTIQALCVNKPREMVCGDGYRVKRSDSQIRILFGDGLGHGEHAKAAVDCAGELFMECDETEPVEILKKLHEKVRKTRGLVASIAILDQKLNEWKICGVGNILTRIYTGIEYKNYMAYNGSLGLTIPNSMKTSLYKAEKNQHIIMCSDGISTRWDVNKYPSVFKFHNTIIAAALYKDFSRGTDDSSVLVGRVD